MKREQPLTDRARQLRVDQTLAEHRLWPLHRSRRLGGFKFRRQHPVGPFFADFCCVEARVIVELDGTAHLGRAEEDRKRDDWLRGQGYVVIRFENCEAKWDEARVRETVYLE